MSQCSIYCLEVTLISYKNEENSQTNSMRRKPPILLKIRIQADMRFPVQCPAHSQCLVSRLTLPPSVSCSLLLKNLKTENSAVVKPRKPKEKFADPLTCYGRCWQDWFCPWLRERKKMLKRRHPRPPGCFMSTEIQSTVWKGKRACCWD